MVSEIIAEAGLWGIKVILWGNSSVATKVLKDRFLLLKLIAKVRSKLQVSYIVCYLKKYFAFLKQLIIILRILIVI